MGSSGLIHGYTGRALWLARGLEPGLCGLWGLSLSLTDGIDPAAVSIGSAGGPSPGATRPITAEGGRRVEQNQLSGGRRLQRRRAAAAAAAALAALAVAWLS